MRHSVILTSYNRPVFVKQAINSVLQQTHPDWELIVVDDGSNAETRSTIKGLIADEPRGFLLDGLEPYPADRSDGCSRLVDCVNIGLERATGDVIHYLADDDFYEVGRFKVFEILFKDPQVIVGFGRLMYTRHDGRPTGRTRYYRTIDIDDPRGMLDHNQVAHRRDVLSKVGYWDRDTFTNYDPDGYFFRKLRALWIFHAIDAVVAYKREHSLNIQVTRERTGEQRE